MSALTTLASGNGIIFVVDLDGTSIIQNLANTTNTVRQILLDASTSAGLSGRAGVYDSSYGKRYFLDATGVAGVLSGTEITQFIVSRGLDSTIPVNSYTIASGVVTPLRYAAITIVNIDTEGAAASDTLDTITTTEFNTGDIIIFRGANSGRIVTFNDGSGNLRLANNIDFLTGPLESAIALQYVSGSGFIELWRTPGIPISVGDFREGGVAVPNYGAGVNTLPTNGTVEFEPGVSANVQVISGSPALVGSVVYQVDPTPSTAYMDGDQMTIIYNATPTGVGANTVTLFGITLTDDQAEGGAVVVTTTYDLGTTTWYSTISPNTEGIDIATTTALAGYEPDLGNPAANGYVLTSTTAGVRSWQPVLSTGVLFFDGSVDQTGANVTPTTLKTYTVPGNTLNQTDEALYICATGDTAANANGKTIDLIIAGFTITTNAIVTAPNNDFWKIEGHIYRTSATGARSTFSFYFNDGATAATTLEIYDNTIAGLDWTADQAVIVRGTNGVATAGDIVSISLAIHKVAKQS